MKHGDIKLKFGKYKDASLNKVPLWYLNWLMGEDFISPRLKNHIIEYIVERSVGGLAEGK